MTSKSSGWVSAPSFVPFFVSPRESSEWPARQFEVIILPAPLVPREVFASKHESRTVLGHFRGPFVSVHQVCLTYFSVLFLLCVGTGVGGSGSGLIAFTTIFGGNRWGSRCRRRHAEASIYSCYRYSIKAGNSRQGVYFTEIFDSFNRCFSGNKNDYHFLSALRILRTKAYRSWKCTRGVLYVLIYVNVWSKDFRFQVIVSLSC